MARYYIVDKASKKLSGELGFGSNSNKIPEHDDNTILIPHNEVMLNGLTFEQFSKAKIAIIVNDEIAEWIDDTEYDKDADTKAKLIKEYTSKMINSVSIGSLESALDLVVQMLDKWVNDQTASELEIEQWNAFVGANEEYFKSNLEDLTPEDITDMAVVKATARKAQRDMTKDKRWPK